MRDLGVLRIRWVETLWCEEERDDGAERDKEAMD